MKREIDFVKTSMNVEDLNKLIIFLRHTSRLCKCQVIQKITRKIAIYKNKRGTKVQVEQNINKCQKLLDEIQILKTSNVDDITKYALNSSLNLKVLSQPETTMKDRALTRVACHKPFKNFIEEWRRQHPDWLSLAAFIQTHISRRYKKNKKLQTSKIKSPILLKNNFDKNIFKDNVDLDLKEFSNEDYEPQISNKASESNSDDDNLDTSYQRGNYVVIDDKSYKLIHSVSIDKMPPDFNIDNEVHINKAIKLKENKKICKKSIENLSQNIKTNVYNNLIHENSKLIKTDPYKNLQDKIPVDYRDGNILVKEFDLNNLNEVEELKFGVINNQLKNEVFAVTKDNFFLRDGEDENNALNEEDKLLLTNEATARDEYDGDETEYRGKYPNKFPKRRFNVNDGKYLDTSNKRNNGIYLKDKKTNFKIVNNNFKKLAPVKSYGAKVNKSVNSKNIDLTKSNLHPSWEASKKKKEQQSNVKFQGKKIVFDD